MRFALTAVCLVACGCGSTTSAELAASKEPVRVQSKRSPSAAIGCVAHTYENAVGVTVGTREADGGTWEASARSPEIGLYAMLYATATPRAGGSALSIWISHRFNVDELVAKLRGC